jgi:hypothetical protein
MGCGLGYLKIQVEFPAGKSYFLKSIRTFSGDHQGSHAVVAGNSELISPKVKQLGVEPV